MSFAAGLTAIPPHGSGLRIGLFGGSFNPIHDGHRLVAEQCLKRLGLDAVWLLVSPGNPLKDNDSLPSLEARVRAARMRLRHPRLVATGLEAQRGYRYTVDTLTWLKRSCPDTHFVWIMGADNLAQFHRWESWRDIAQLMPIAVYDRPGATLRAMAALAAQSLAPHRIPEQRARELPLADPPAWTLLTGVTSALSSSAIRQGRASGTK